MRGGKYSGAPLGSTYHYFPGGKSELAVAAVEHANTFICRALRRELTAGGPVDGMREFLVMWRKIIVDSDYRAGCPVLAVAVEEPDDDDAPCSPRPPRSAIGPQSWQTRCESTARTRSSRGRRRRL